MTGEERRLAILNMLKEQELPLSGTALASHFHVCRQVMREFCDDDFVLYLVDAEGYEAHTLAEILPFSFSAKKHMV